MENNLIKQAINEKGFNDGTMQVVHLSPGHKYDCGDVLMVGYELTTNNIVVLVADNDDNHFWLNLDEIEENAYFTYCNIVSEILNLK